MIKNKRNAGFSLVELIIVTAIIAIIAAIAVPRLLASRLAANENAAIASLRSVATAQQQFQASSAIDTDADGGGEYGFFAELAGVAPMRIYAPAGPATGTADDVLVPAFLPKAFGRIQAQTGGSGGGVVVHQGYVFKIFLPRRTAGGQVLARVEAKDGSGTKDWTLNGWGSANCEILWCAYAWPMDAGSTGNRVFFINQDGDVAAYHNRDQRYEGLRGVDAPRFGAALDKTVIDWSMDEAVAFASMGFAANDNNTWTQVGN